MNVTGSATTGDGFSVSGLAIDEFVAAGETKNATVGFDRLGRLNGVYNGGGSVRFACYGPTAVRWCVKTFSGAMLTPCL